MEKDDTLFREAIFKVADVLLPYIHNSSEASLKLVNHFIRDNKSPQDFQKGTKPPFMGICLNNISLGEKAIIDFFKFIKMIKKMKAEKKTKVAKAKKEVKEIQKGEALQVRYDYPLIDGEPMSTELKKKYRILMRKYLKKEAMDMKEAQKKASKEILQFKDNTPKEKPTPKKESKKEVKSKKETKVVKGKKETSEKPKKVVKKKIREDED